MYCGSVQIMTTFSDIFAYKGRSGCPSDSSLLLISTCLTSLHFVQLYCCQPVGTDSALTQGATTETLYSSIPRLPLAAAAADRSDMVTLCVPFTFILASDLQIIHVGYML